MSIEQQTIEMEYELELCVLPTLSTGSKMFAKGISNRKLGSRY